MRGAPLSPAGPLPAQMERLTIAGARYAGMGLRAGHLVALGTAIHDAIQVRLRCELARLGNRSSRALRKALECD